MNATPTVRLIAPSGWPAPQALARGVARLRTDGCHVDGEASGQRRHLRFAGDDDERAADINALADPATPLSDIVMAVRGGYGLHRLLERLDYAGLKRRLDGSSCALVGHSDITALSLALLARCGLVSFAGPMLAYDFGGDAVSDYTLTTFWQTLRQTSHTLRWPVGASDSVDASGVLWGGNLAIICSLLGTSYFPSVTGGILFIEEVGEPLYRIERMLWQLQLAGVLDCQKALIIGDLADVRADAYAPDYDLSAVLERMRRVTNTPIVTGLPFGHCPDKATLPVGAPAALQVTADSAALTFHDHPCPLA